MSDTPDFRLYHNKKTEKVVRAGEKIFSEEEEGDVMYVVAEGLIDIVKDGSVLETVQPGGIFGEMAIVDNQPRSANAVAKVDCVVSSIDHKKFLYLVQETPLFAVQVMRVMAARLRRSSH